MRICDEHTFWRPQFNLFLILKRYSDPESRRTVVWLLNECEASPALFEVIYLHSRLTILSSTTQLRISGVSACFTFFMFDLPNWVLSSSRSKTTS